MQFCEIRAGMHALAAPGISYRYGGDCMGRYCVGGGGGRRSRILGALLMVVGLLVLLLFVPYWVWTSVLAVLLISIGFLIWRFG